MRTRLLLALHRSSGLSQMKPALFAVLLSTIPATAMLAADSFPPPAQLPASIEPPDPLVMLNGDRVSTKEEWFQKRAPELRALFQHYMYGKSPRQVRPVEGRVIREDKEALGGKATLREVLVTAGVERPVHLMVVTPNKRDKPAACFLGLNFSGNYALLDDPQIQMPQGWVSEKYAGSPGNRAGEAGRGKQKDTWAIEQSIDRGYAVATFYNGDVIPDEKGLAAKALAALADDETSGADGANTATIMAWAWAFSTMWDYLATIPEIDSKRVAVVGHSRNGKTALLAAAMDERIAMAIPSQAGCGGTAPSRVSPALSAPNNNGRPTAETVAVINKSFPHWFCGNFKAFNEAPEKLPFDQHALIALCAPRPVLVSNATEDLWANPAGQFEMLRAASPVYKLVSGEGVGAETMPDVGKLLDSRLGYYIRPGKHAMTAADWKVWLDYADKWLR